MLDGKQVMNYTQSGVKDALTVLQTQRDNISKIYGTTIKNALERSKACISVSGLNFDNIISSFNDTFNKVIGNLDALAEVLDKGVILRYNQLTEEIKAMFNTEFATKMTELCNDDNTLPVNVPYKYTVQSPDQNTENTLQYLREHPEDIVYRNVEKISTPQTHNDNELHNIVGDLGTLKQQHRENLEQLSREHPEMLYGDVSK